MVICDSYLTTLTCLVFSALHNQLQRLIRCIHVLQTFSTNVSMDRTRQEVCSGPVLALGWYYWFNIMHQVQNMSLKFVSESSSLKVVLTIYKLWCNSPESGCYSPNMNTCSSFDLDLWSITLKLSSSHALTESSKCAKFHGYWTLGRSGALHTNQSVHKHADLSTPWSAVRGHDPQNSFLHHKSLLYINCFDK